MFESPCDKVIIILCVKVQGINSYALQIQKKIDSSLLSVEEIIIILYIYINSLQKEISDQTKIYVHIYMRVPLPVHILSCID